MKPSADPDSTNRIRNAPVKMWAESFVHWLKVVGGRTLVIVHEPTFHRLRFFYRLRYWPDLDHPRTINEHLSALKRDLVDGGVHRRYTDKILVRDFIENVARERSLPLELVPLLATAESISALDLDAFDEPVFIKTNHASATTLRYVPNVTDKKRVRRKVAAWMSDDYSSSTGERSYEGIARGILVERSLEDPQGNVPDDIKIHCYHGRPRVVQVIRRHERGMLRDIFDENWVRRAWYRDQAKLVDPAELPGDDLLDIARTLAEGWPYVRVDLYVVAGRIYFGELTFFPSGGMMPLVSREVDLQLGALFAADRDAAGTHLAAAPSQ